MKRYISNNRLFFLLGTTILLMVTSFISVAQSDTISDAYKSYYEQNLNELDELSFWDKDNVDFEIIQSSSPVNIEEEFNNLQISYFNDYLRQTALYYEYLEGLEIRQKQKVLGYYFYYEKDFEIVLEGAGLPGDLKYIVPALSLMNPKAVSPDQRAGVWQLTHFQALLQGLQITKLLDERFLVLPSSAAAAQQIKLYLDQFNSIELAISAYLFGNTRVRNASQLAENNNLGLREFLPESYIEKVASIQAMAIFLNRNRPKRIIESELTEIKPDTVSINRKLHFQQIEEVLGIPMKELESLNPQFKFSIVPGDEKVSQLLLPKGEWDDFVLWQDSIYNSGDSSLFQLVTQKIEYPPSPNRQYAREPVKDLEIEGKTKIQYRLQTGDVLGIIAETYDVRVADLKYWNNIFNERKIQAGKKLDIFVDDDKADYYLSLTSSQKKGSTAGTKSPQKNTTPIDLSTAKKVEHVVKNGESPYVIAKKYNGVTPDEILEWNNIDDARKIQIGQKLIVYIR